jgi:hypothetical protein
VIATGFVREVVISLCKLLLTTVLHLFARYLSSAAFRITKDDDLPNLSLTRA